MYITKADNKLKMLEFNDLSSCIFGKIKKQLKMINHPIYGFTTPIVSKILANRRVSPEAIARQVSSDFASS